MRVHRGNPKRPTDPVLSLSREERDRSIQGETVRRSARPRRAALGV